MVTASIAGMTIGLVLIMVAAATKKEKWRLAYGLVGLIFILYSLQYFSFGRLDQSLLPALTLLFGLFSFYTKGSAQLISILTTLVLVFQIAIP
jgi:hypothetical protein